MTKGSIEKRDNGSYRVHVSLTSDGIRKQITRTAHSPQEAEKLRTKLMNQKYEGVLSRQPKGNIEQYLNRWLADYVVPNLSPNTVQGYSNIIITHLIPKLGKIALKNIKAEHLQSYYADRLKAGLDATTVRHHHTLLHRAFKQAVQLDLMPRNPTDAVSPPRYHKKELRILDEAQVDLVLNNAGTYYPLFYLALFSGLRRGELLALRWSDVDLIMAELSVSRSLVSLTGGGFVFKSPKTEKSRRTVALSPSTCQVLREHLEKQMTIKRRLDIPFKNDDLIFSHINGHPLNGSAVSMVWRNLVRKLELRGVRFHDCRHTMATAMLRAGVHPKIVQERLGHSSIAITLDTYSHVAPGLQHAAANQMDTMFQKSVTNSLPLAEKRI